jgi:hypothetical protein
VDDLKSKLKKMGCSPTGNKALLIKRLYLTKLSDEKLRSFSESCGTSGTDHKTLVQGLEKVSFEDKIEGTGTKSIKLHLEILVLLLGIFRRVPHPAATRGHPCALLLPREEKKMFVFFIGNL